MGYSLPLNDSALASMLSRTLGDSSARATVVNLETESIVTKLANLGIDSTRIHSIEGPQSIETYVRTWTMSASNWLLDQIFRLGRVRARSPLAVGWRQGEIAAVEGIRYDAEARDLQLVTSGLGDVSALHRPGTLNGEGRTESTNLVLSALHAQLEAGAAPISISVDIPGAGKWMLGGFVDQLPGLEFDSPSNGDENWIVFRPVGQTPRG